ncbi:MAG: hypothetical protein ACM3JJ_02205 [Hyphomicrobiales bacterium]
MEWYPPAATRRPLLPPVSGFLRESFSLGNRSIRRALPALVFLCFYYFGTGLYLEFAVKATGPLGEPDARAQIVHLMMSLVAYLPLLVLIQLPFLPLQDTLRRGERIGFLDAIRRVLERFPALAGAGIVQSLVVFVPALLILLIGAAFVAGAGTVSQEAAMAAVLLLLFPVVAWCALASAYFSFVGPIVILDAGGPLDSIRRSLSLVWGHFWGLAGRVFLFTVLVILGFMVVTFPATMLQVGAAVSGAEPPAVKASRVLWTSVATALILPYWVAALVVLYRSLVPGAEETAPGEAAPPAPGPTVGPSSPDPAARTPDDPETGANPQLFE